MPHAQSSESAAAASAVPVGTPGGAITSLDLSHHTPSPPCSPDPEGTVAAREAREQRRVSAVLGGLPRGSRVAVLSLLGSLNPITLGHVQMMTEARRALLDPLASGDRFDEVIALIAVNSDGHVSHKLRPDQRHLLFNAGERRALIDASTAHLPWCFSAEFIRSSWSCNFDAIKRQYSSRITFVEYLLNGADDVVKYEKWWNVKDHEEGERYVTVGRPGYTEKVREGLAQRIESLGVDSEGAAVIRRAFVIVPELPGHATASSTAAREAALRGDRERLLTIVAPKVADALLERAQRRS